MQRFEFPWVRNTLGLALALAQSLSFLASATVNLFVPWHEPACQFFQ